MTNPYYNHSTYPITGALGSSALLRAELDAVAAGFALLPTLAAAGNQLVVINAGGTAMGTTTTPVGLTISGATNTLSNIANGSLTNSAVTVGSTSISLGATAGTIAGLTLTSPTITNPSITGTAGLASATVSGTLGVTGVATLAAAPVLSALTASQAVFTDASKGLVSKTLTGTGSVVLSDSPTHTGTIAAASQTLSGSLTVGTTFGVTGVATFTAQPIVSSLTASQAVFTDASKGLVSKALTGTGSVVLSDSPALTTTMTLGTLGYSETGVLASFQSSLNSFNQLISRNSNAGAAASTGYVVSNDSGTATTYYGEFGMNSSGFTGSGGFNAPNAVYLSAINGPLVLGTLDTNNVRVVVNNGATDAVIINGTTGVMTLGAALPVTSGGTGATTLGGVRAAISAAASGANSDITSLASLSTPLSVAQGGVGAATLTLNNVLLGNGTSTLQAVAPSSSGNILTSNGTTWISGAPPTGTIPSLTGNSLKYLQCNVGETAAAWAALSLTTITVPSGAPAGIMTITGGSSTAAQSGNSGGVVIVGGAAGAVANVAGGPIVLTAGAGAATGNATGGAVTITSGAGGATSGASGAVTISSSATTGTGSSGIVTLATGNTTGAAVGALNITAGGALTAGNPGGTIIITAGLGNTTGAGGALTLTSGSGGASGAAGALNLNVGTTNAGTAPVLSSNAKRVQFGANSASQTSVSAADGAMALGGSYASGADSFAAAIGNNTSTYGAQGANSIAIGRQSLSISQSSIAVGEGNSSTGPYASTLGGYCVANNAYSSSLGFRASSTQIGKYSYASGMIAAQGDAQYGIMVLRGAPGSGVSGVMTSDGAAASNNNQLIVATSQAMTVTGMIVGKVTGTAQVYSATFTAQLINNGGTVTLGAAVTLANVTDGITLTTAPTVTADNTNKGLAVTSGAKTATVIKWVATLQSVELTY